jgi:hypothetical protein
MRSLSFIARIITFYEELFDEGGWLESGFYRFSRALSRFMKRCLMRVVRLKAVSVVFVRALSRFMKSCLTRVVHLKAFSVIFVRALSRFMKSCLTRVARLKAVSIVFRAHYRVL